MIIAPGEDDKHTFYTTDKFVMPKGVSDEDMAAINTTLGYEHYSAAPLIDGSAREKAFGSANPAGLIGPFAIEAFAMLSIQPTKPNYLGLETIVSVPPPDTEVKFLKFCQGLIAKAGVLPDGPKFPMRMTLITQKFAQMGLRIVSGVVINVDMNNPELKHPALVVPKIFTNEFKGPEDTEPNDLFAIRLSAVWFSHLAQKYLDTLKS